MRQICSESCRWRKPLEVLREDLAPAAAAFPMLECVELGFDRVVRPIDEANVPAGLFGQTDRVAPQKAAVPFQMREDNVDCLSQLLCRTLYWAALPQGADQMAHLGADVLQLDSRLSWLGRPELSTIGLFVETERFAQLGEESGPPPQPLGDRS